MMAKVEKKTIIVIPADPEELAAVSTFDRKWINRMEKLAETGDAEEVEPSVEGAREWEFDRKMLRLPFVRTSREWTEEQRETARVRLAAVRAAVKAQREEEEEEVEEAPKSKKKAAAAAPASKTTAKTAPAKTATTAKAKPGAKKAEPEPVKVDAMKKPVGAKTGKGKDVVATPAPTPKKKSKIVEEEIEDEFDEDEVEEVDDMDEEEEVIVKRPARKRR